MVIGFSILGISAAIIAFLKTPKEKRGIASSVIAGFGIFGAVVAFFLKENFDWRTCYFIGGGMGLALLVLRVSIFESGLFSQLKETNIDT